MHTATAETADLTAARWRSGADTDNPAGPLFVSGTFARTDIVMPGRALTRLSCFARTACTASGGTACC